jgi:hypothetical protein
VLQQIWALLCNYLWACKKHITQSRVKWHICCVMKEIGGLGVIHLKENYEKRGILQLALQPNF